MQEVDGSIPSGSTNPTPSDLMRPRTLKRSLAIVCLFGTTAVRGGHVVGRMYVDTFDVCREMVRRGVGRIRACCMTAPCSLTSSSRGERIYHRARQ
jgi:hypothetical protein